MEDWYPRRLRLDLARSCALIHKLYIFFSPIFYIILGPGVLRYSLDCHKIYLESFVAIKFVVVPTNENLTCEACEVSVRAVSRTRTA